MRRFEQGRVGAGIAFVWALCVLVFPLAVAAADSDSALAPSVVVASAAVGSVSATDSGPGKGRISKERVEMLVEKDFWTHRGKGHRPRMGDLWFFQTPYSNMLASGDFLTYTVIIYNSSSDSSIDFSYGLNLRKYVTGGLNQDGEIIKSYSVSASLSPNEWYCLNPIFFFGGAGDYWLETVINGHSVEGLWVGVRDGYEYGD
jgi:hypothetical protein